MQSSLLSRKQKQKKSNYQDYKQDLRDDFLYSCAYCTTAEIELSAKRFEIEHYLPQKHFSHLRNQYLNLLWSCEDCNKNKDDFYPGSGGDFRGFSVFRPDRHRIEEHFLVEGNELKGKTEKIGTFTIKLLRLNSKRLIDLRLRRREKDELEESIAYGIRHLEVLFRQAGSKTHRSKLFQSISQLKLLKTSYDDALRQIARQRCPAAEQDPDPAKSTQLRDRQKYLASLKK